MFRDAQFARKQLVRLAIIIAAIGAIACADAMTASAVNKRGKPTADLTGDSTLCRSGFAIVDGRIICNEQ